MLHPVSAQNCCIEVLPDRPAFARPQEYVAYEFVPTSLSVSGISGSSNMDSFHDGWLVAVQLLLCVVLPPGLIQYCSQHSCVVAVKLFLCV